MAQHKHSMSLKEYTKVFADRIQPDIPELVCTEELWHALTSVQLTSTRIARSRIFAEACGFPHSELEPYYSQPDDDVWSPYSLLRTTALAMIFHAQAARALLASFEDEQLAADVDGICGDVLGRYEDLHEAFKSFEHRSRVKGTQLGADRSATEGGKELESCKPVPACQTSTHASVAAVATKQDENPAQAGPVVASVICDLKPVSDKHTDILALDASTSIESSQLSPELSYDDDVWSTSSCVVTTGNSSRPASPGVPSRSSSPARVSSPAPNPLTCLNHSNLSPASFAACDDCPVCGHRLHTKTVLRSPPCFTTLQKRSVPSSSNSSPCSKMPRINKT